MIKGKELRGKIDNISDDLDWVDEYLEENGEDKKIREALNKAREAIEILFYAIPIK